MGGQTFQQLSELKRKQTDNVETGAGLPQGDLTIPHTTWRFTVSCIVQLMHTQGEATKRNCYSAGRYVLTPGPYKPSTHRGRQSNSTLLPEVSRLTSFKNCMENTRITKRNKKTIHRQHEAVEDFGLPQGHAKGSYLTLLKVRSNLLSRRSRLSGEERRKKKKEEDRRQKKGETRKKKAERRQKKEGRRQKKEERRRKRKEERR